jgi:hypothetical protein
MTRLLIVLTAVFLGYTPTAFGAPRCDGQFKYPTDFLICNDQQLAALDEEAEALSGKALKNLSVQERAGLQGGPSLRRRLEKVCNLPTLVDVPTALRMRPCIVAEYKLQIKKLAGAAGPLANRLHERPSALNSKKTTLR